jgi:hypothetical protein
VYAGDILPLLNVAFAVILISDPTSYNTVVGDIDKLFDGFVSEGFSVGTRIRSKILLNVHNAISPPEFNPPTVQVVGDAPIYTPLPPDEPANTIEPSTYVNTLPLVPPVAIIGTYPLSPINAKPVGDAICV